MTIPANDNTNIHLDNSLDDPSQARTEILAMHAKLTALINDLGPGNTMLNTDSSLDSSKLTGGIPAAILPGGYQIFTSNGTFTLPAGVTRIKVWMTGGGGGGAKDSNVYECWGGHASRTELYVIDSPSSSYAVTIGAGGGPAGAGAASGFGGLTSDRGFGGSTSNTGSADAGGQGGLGGDLKIIFEADRPPNPLFATAGFSLSGRGGHGGTSYYGQGGVGSTVNQGSDAGNGTAYGSGGGGYYGSAAGRTGGDGAPGVVIVEWGNNIGLL